MFLIFFCLKTKNRFGHCKKKYKKICMDFLPPIVQRTVSTKVKEIPFEDPHNVLWVTVHYEYKNIKKMFFLLTE